MHADAFKQMEQLGGLLEKMDRERDAMKRSVDDMEKGHREATKAAITPHNNALKGQYQYHHHRFVELLCEKEEQAAGVGSDGKDRNVVAVLRGGNERVRSAFGTVQRSGGDGVGGGEGIEEEQQRYNNGEEMVRSARAFLEEESRIRTVVDSSVCSAA